MGESGMEAKSIAELDKVMSLLIRDFPKEKLAFMKKQGMEMRKVAKKYGRRVVKKRTGNLFKGIEVSKPWEEPNETKVNLKYKYPANHGHLLELGHKMVGHKPNYINSGEVKGYHILVRGKYLFAKQFFENVENNLADFIVKKLEKKK